MAVSSRLAGVRLVPVRITVRGSPKAPGSPVWGCRWGLGRNRGGVNVTDPLEIVMNMRTRSRRPSPANTVRYGRAYTLRETSLEALVHHGTNVVHRSSIETVGPVRLGVGPCGPAVYCTLDLGDAVRWAWSSVRRDRELVSDPCGEDLWPIPMVATFALRGARAVLARGWDWDLPKALASHLGVSVPGHDRVEDAVADLGVSLAASGVDVLVCLDRVVGDTVAVYRPAALTLLSCRTLTDIRGR